MPSIGMANESENRKVLIVDDQPLIQEGLMQVISQQGDFELCGSADSVASARRVIELERPDLVILDLLLPDGFGLELIGDLRFRHPSLRILVISQCNEALYAESALKAGAQGFLMKSQAASEIPAAMRAVLAGEFYVSPRVAALALHQIASKSPSGNIGNLTNRECQVFQLIGAGMRIREVATRLELSFKSVQSHCQKIKHKLKLSSMAELVAYARNWVEGSAQKVLADTAQVA